MKTAIWVLIGPLLMGSGLMAQSKPNAPPVQDGSVRLPLSDYQRLLERARSAGQEPPVAMAVASSRFELDAQGDVPRLLSTFEILSLSDKPQSLRLPDLGVLTSSEIVGGAAALITGDANEIRLRLPGKGSAVIRIGSIPTHDQHERNAEISWQVPDSPSNRLIATLPPGDSDVVLSGGSETVASAARSPVRVEGTLERGAAARLSYSAASAPSVPEKLLAQASESRLYRIGEKTLGIASRLRIEVLGGALDRFSIRAPADLHAASAWASGNTVTSFQAVPDRAGEFLLTLARPVEASTVDLFLLFEKTQPIASGQLALPEIEFPDFLRGETDVAVASSHAVVIDEAVSRHDGYERIDERDLPADLLEMADSTVLVSLRRITGAAPSLSVRLSLFPDASGLPGVIDHAEVLTLSTRQGRRIDRWILDFQSREPVLAIPLPSQAATIWSLELDGKPIRPLTENGKLLVPLGHGDQTMGERRIELVLDAASPLPAARGRARIELARFPYPVTRLDWDLLLPETLQYRTDGGNVEPIEEGQAEDKAEPIEGGVPGGVEGGVGTASIAFDNERGAKLSGQVLDENGGFLPGVEVMLSGSAGQARSAVTDSNGFYRFDAVAPGAYRVRAKLLGFAPSERPVSLPASGNVGVDLKMRLSSVQATVTVRGEAPLLDARQATTGASFAFGNSSPQAKAAAKAAPAPPPVLTAQERAALQRTTQAGVRAIAVEIPESGKRLRFEGRLLDEQPFLDLEARPVKRGWLW